MQLNLNKNDLIQQRYIIQQKIGEGGMSVVYKATDKERKRDVALKFLKPGITSSYVEDVIRFKKEAELVSKFEHPHIIKLYGTGDYDNTPYLIEELLEGRTLSDLLEQKNAFSVKEAVQVIRQIIEALNYVHHKGVIHRDLKPGNIMICNPLAVDRLPLSVESRKSGVTPPQRTTANGKRATLNIKLLDFGLAHIMELSKIKEEKEIVGTFGYMSPEATGIMNKRIDERSDLYSLGIIFYQLLSERLPFNATDISTLLHQQVAIEPPKLKEIKPDIPKILEEIIIKLLNKEPDLRYQSAKGLLYDIDRYQKGEMSFIIGEKDQKIKISYQTRLVGREEETHKIKELFDRARDNQGRICLINGEPGVGKSKLVEETLEYLYDQGYKKDGVFISARCLNQENKIPYQPFRDALNDYIRKIEDIDDQEKQNQEIERIKNVVGDLNEIIVHLNPNMKDILGKTQKLINLDPERENQRFLMATSNFFCNLAQKGENCVLFIDDLQWADEASLRLIQEIATKIDKSNLLILGTYRDEEINKKHGLNRVKKEPVVNDIKLKKLDYKRLNKMIANILGEEQEKAYVLTEYILNKSEGNPFFAITILRELVEQKALIWEHGYWKEDWDKIKTIRISDNIIDMILRRIKGLSDELDRLLRIGASIGKEFEIKMLYELIDEKREAIISWIDEAENMQLLERSITKKGKVLFIHDRIREAF
ncbi:MAG: AAA family ATPase, partial [Spirochaetes bacterium]|nr:AAA family ATPase [Spirochaetota bacterium]